MDSYKIIPTRTTQLLQSLLYIYRPKVWYFAHFHDSWQGESNGTHFRCLGTYETLEIEI